MGLGVALSMPSWFESVMWVMVSHAVAGILHVQIVLSHWSMHSYEGRAYTGKDDEWYITTMRTTMNVKTHPLLDWTHIGLQFQVEHHLFPRLPRHNLRIARDMVKEVVEKHFPAGSPECKRLFPLGVAYHEPGFFEVTSRCGTLSSGRRWRRAVLKRVSTASGTARLGEPQLRWVDDQPPGHRIPSTDSTAVRTDWYRVPRTWYLRVVRFIQESSETRY